jgi:hypothetical protein
MVLTNRTGKTSIAEFQQYQQEPKLEEPQPEAPLDVNAVHQMDPTQWAEWQDQEQQRQRQLFFQQQTGQTPSKQQGKKRKQVV